ncbi:MAG: DNA polymerase III subunit delta [Gemmatimonadaceae bacterium]
MSSPQAQRTLRKAVQERSFDPVYYLHGDDDFLKDDAVRQLVAAAVDPATRDFNLDVRRGAELDGESLGVLLATMPMMAERRVVVVRDVGALRKDARAALDRYLAHPAPDVVVVLVQPAGAKADKALTERATTLAFPTLTGDRVPKWIAHYASSELGASIAPGAAELLQSAVGSELPQLAAELDKLASYANGAEIDERAVSEVVGVRRGETLGDLLDRVAQRDGLGAVALVEHVLSQPKTNAVLVVMALTTQTLALAWGQAMRQGGTSLGALSKMYFEFLKEGSGYPGRPWGEAASAWTKAVDRWDAASLDRALDLLLAADVALKETRLSTDEQTITTLVLALSAGAPRRAAA